MARELGMDKGREHSLRDVETYWNELGFYMLLH